MVQSVLLTLPSEVRSPPGALPGAGHRRGSLSLGTSQALRPFSIDRARARPGRPVKGRRRRPGRGPRAVGLPPPPRSLTTIPPSLLTGVPARQDAGPSERLGLRARKRARRPLSGLVPAFLCLRPAEGWPLDLGPVRGLPGVFSAYREVGPALLSLWVRAGHRKM